MGAAREPDATEPHVPTTEPAEPRAAASEMRAAASGTGAATSEPGAATSGTGAATSGTGTAASEPGTARDGTASVEVARGRSIFVRARLAVHDGRRAEFEEITRSLTARAAEEPGTLTYRWFGPDGDDYLVIEEYADTPAALAHNERSADLLQRVPECAELASAEVYGTLGAELAEWVAAHPQVVAYADFPITD